MENEWKATASEVATALTLAAIHGTRSEKGPEATAIGEWWEIQYRRVLELLRERGV